MGDRSAHAVEDDVRAPNIQPPQRVVEFKLILERHTDLCHGGSHNVSIQRYLRERVDTRHKDLCTVARNSLARPTR